MRACSCRAGRWRCVHRRDRDGRRGGGHHHRRGHRDCGPPISTWTATSISSSARTAPRACCATTATAPGSRSTSLPAWLARAPLRGPISIRMRIRMPRSSPATARCTSSINRQSTRFVPLDAPAGLDGLTAITAADLDADGAIDLVRWEMRRGRISRITRRAGALADRRRWTPGRGAPLTRVLVADLDNNGALDIVASRADGVACLAGHGDGLRRLPQRLPRWTGRVGDARSQRRRPPRSDRRVGVGVASRWSCDSGRAAITGRRCARARSQNAGDQRINSFGSAARSRSGPGCCRQKQVIDRGTVHFGLGHAHRRRRGAHRLAERRPAGRVRSSAPTSVRGRAAAEGIVPVGVRRTTGTGCAS